MPVDATPAFRNDPEYLYELTRLIGGSNWWINNLLFAYYRQR